MVLELSLISMVGHGNLVVGRLKVNKLKPWSLIIGSSSAHCQKKSLTNEHSGYTSLDAGIDKVLDLGWVKRLILPWSHLESLVLRERRK